MDHLNVRGYVRVIVRSYRDLDPKGHLMSLGRIGAHLILPTPLPTGPQLPL